MQVKLTATEAMCQHEEMPAFQTIFRVFYPLELYAEAKSTRWINLLG